MRKSRVLYKLLYGGKYEKHSFKTIISLLLVICLSLSIVPITAFAEDDNNASGLEDLIAGVSSVEDIYGELVSEHYVIHHFQFYFDEGGI